MESAHLHMVSREISVSARNVFPACAANRLYGRLAYIRARWKFVNDFVLAISGMHAQGLVHCDVKPDNVLAQIFPCT